MPDSRGGREGRHAAPSSGEPEYQRGYSEQHPDEMYDTALRRRKAEKTLAVLRDWVTATGRCESGLSLLDVGCSTGFVADLAGDSFQRVVGIDIDERAVAHARARFERTGVSFLVGDSLRTSFESESFDVVTCSQIYEHVPSPERLLSEIYRVLKPGGACYFAAGNRLVLIEPHYRLPLLSLFPKPIAHRYLRLAGRGEHYYENHLYCGGLRRLVADFEVVDYSRRIIEDPVRFCATELVQPGSLRQRVALALFDLAYWLCPTYVWVLVKPA